MGIGKYRTDTPEIVALGLQEYGAMRLYPIVRGTEENAKIMGILAHEFVSSHSGDVRKEINRCVGEYGHPCSDMVTKQFFRDFTRYVRENADRFIP